MDLNEGYDLDTACSECDCCQGNLFYLSSEDIYNDLFEYFVNKPTSKNPISNVFTETLYHVSLMLFDENDGVCKYRFEKKSSSPCPGQGCGCSCLTEGRFRCLEVVYRNGDESLIREDDHGLDLLESSTKSDRLKSSRIEFQSQQESQRNFNLITKLIWCWCQNRLVIGEFNGIPRKQEIVAQPLQHQCDSALNQIFEALS